MSSPPKFTIRIAKKAYLFEEEIGIMNIVVQQPFPHLERELRRAFKGQEDVKVILNRRQGERRKNTKAVGAERRKADRRHPTEEIVEVVVST